MIWSAADRSQRRRLAAVAACLALPALAVVGILIWWLAVLAAAFG